MASVSKRTDKDGRVVSYRIRVSRGRGMKPFEMTWPPRGERIPDTWSKRTIEKEVARIAASFEEKCRRGEVSTERLTFEQYANMVIDQKESCGIKHRTVHRYRELLARTVDVDCNGIGHIQLQDLRPDQINLFYRTLAQPGQKKTGGTLSPKTILEHARLVHCVLGQAVKEGLIPYNVADRATPPKVRRKEAAYLEREDIDAVFESLKDESLKWRALTHFLIATGARRGEALGLQWEHVDFRNNQVYLCNNTLYSPERGIYHDSLKTGESRYVSVAQPVMDILKAWKNEQALQRLKKGALWQDTGYVFTQDSGLEMHPDSVTDWYAKFSKRHNLPPIHPHMFRHTSASLLIGAGVDVVSVSKRLGHAKTSTTTDIYSHVLKKADEKASDVLNDLLYRKKA